jgi:hypothetical protein
MGASRLTQDHYFAAAPDDELGDRLWSKFENSQRDVTSRAARWNAAFLHYIGDETEAGRTWGAVRRGDKGELAAIRINRARRNSKARQALIASGRVVWKPKASTSDAEAEVATLVSGTWLEHDYKVSGIETLWKQWIEYSEVFDHAYTYTEWDRTRGSPVPTPGGTMRDGDLRTTLLPPWLVSGDNSVPSPEDRNWHFVVLSRPKPDLVMLHTEIQRGNHTAVGEEAERIIWDARADVFQPLSDRYGEENNDNADLLVFIHRPTLLMPLGLSIGMLGADCILWKRPLIGKAGAYDDLGPHPLIRLSADEIPGTPHGWAPFYNVLANQEMLDGIDTVAATIVTGYGNPVYSLPHGAGEKIEKLGAGNRVWRLGPGKDKPELIDRPEISETLLKYREALADDMVQDFAINDSALGQLPDSERNAQAEALAASMAVQQVAPQAASARRALMTLGELRLKTMRKNMQGERLLKAVGESRRHLLEGTKFFTARQLEPLETVELEEGNPMEDTPQGRQAMLDFLGEHGLIKNGEDIVAVVTTGRLAPVIDPVQTENRLIEAENEMIQRGEVPKVWPTHNDVLHYRQHAEPTLSISAGNNTKLLGAEALHSAMHYQQRYGVHPRVDPAFRARHEFLMGRTPQDIPPPFMPPPPMNADGTPMPQPGAPTQTPPPAAGESSQTPAPSPVQPSSTAAPAVKQPNETTNPMTGQPFSTTQPPIGGMPS